MSVAKSVAATLYWDGGNADLSGNGDGVSAGGIGTWTSSLLNWDAGLDMPYVALGATDDAVLGGAGGTVDLGGNVSANSLTFAASGYTLTGGAGSYGLTLGAGGLTAYYDATISAAVALSQAQTWNIDTGATLTQSGALSGSVLLTKSGAGTLVLGGSSGTTGGLTINAGTVQFATGALGASGTVTVGGGTLRWASGNTTDLSSRLALVNSTTATLDIGENNVTFASAVGSGTSAGLTKAGAGTLTLGAASTLSGAVTVAGGTIKQGIASALGSASSFSIASGASFDTNGLAGLSGKAVTIAGTGVAGATGIQAAALYNGTNTGAAFGNITLSGDATVATAGGGSSAAAPSRSAIGAVNLGGYTLTLIGTSATTPGFFSLTSPQFSNGNVIARGGAVLFGGSAALITNGTAATLTLQADGYLNFRDLNSTTTTNLVSIVLDGGTIASAGTVNGLWLDNSATNGGGTGITNLPNPITVAAGGGRFISNNSSFGIDINLYGSLSGSGDLAVSGNRNLALKGDASGYTGTLTTTGATPLVFNPVAASQTFGGSLAGTSGFTKVSANTTVLAGGSTMTGATKVDAGTLRLDYTANNGRKATAGALTLGANGSPTIDLVGGSGFTETFTGTTLTNASVTTLSRSSGSNSLDLATVTTNNGALNLLNEGFVKVSNAVDANGYLGVWATFGTTAQLATKDANGFVVAAATTDGARLGAGTQVISGTSATNFRLVEGSGSSANFTLADATNAINSLAQSASGGASAATVDLANRSLGINYLLVGSGAGALTIGTSAGSGVIKSTGTALAIRDQAGAGITVNSVIANGTGASSLTKLDTGTLTLTARNTYTGNTVVGAGTLALTGSSQLGAGVYTGTVALTNGGMTFSSSAAQVLAGVISGSGTLTKSTGTGVLALTANNTYTGATTVSAGTLQIGDTTVTDSRLVSSVTVNTGATLAFYRGSTAYTYGGVLAGAGTVRFLGNGGSAVGDYALSGAMTLTGGVVLAGGRLNVDALADVATTSGITVNQGGQVFVSTAIAFAKGLTLNGYGWNESAGYLGAIRLDSTNTTATSAITLGSNARIGVYSSAAATLSGAITGTGGLDIYSSANTKTITLSNASGNTYSGITTVTSAKLIATGTLTGTSSVYVGSTGIAEFQGVNTFSGLTTTVGYNRVLTADGGQIILGAFAGGRVGNITLQNGGTLTSNQTVASTADWAIANTGMGAAQVTVANTGANTSAATLASGATNAGVHLNGNVTFNVADVTGNSTSDLNVNLILANHATGVLDGSTAYTSGALTKRGAGTMTLNAANTYAGTTTVVNGTVALSTAAGAIASSATLSLSGGSTLLLNNTAAANNTNRLLDSAAVNLSGATLNLANDAGAANFSETAGVLTIGGGQNTVTLGQAAAGQTSTLTFASLARTSGAVNFAINGGTAITGTANTRANIVLTTPYSTASSNGIIGTWATVNQADWATMSATGGSVVAYTGYTDVSAAGSTITGTSTSNIRVTGAGTSGAIALGTTTALYTLLMADTTTAATLATAGKTLSIAGVYAGTGRAALTLGAAVGDGLLQAASAGGTLMIGSDSANGITVNAVIQNNTSASGLLKFGTGLVTLAGNNTFSGTVNLAGGTLRVAHTGGIGSGSLTLAGGTLQLATDTAVASRAVTLAGNATIVLDRATAGAGITTTFSTLTFNESYILSVSKGANVTSGTANLTFSGLVQLGGTQGRVAGFDVGAGAEVSLTAGNTGTGVYASIDKLGAGTLIMSGSYTYWDPAGNSGRIAVNGGTLDLRGSSVLGDGTNGANSIGVALAAATTVKFASDTSLGIAGSNAPWIQAAGDGATVTLDRQNAGAGVTHTFQGLEVRGAYTVNFTAGANITSGTNQVNLTTGTLWGNTTLAVAAPAAGSNVVNFTSAISDVGGPRSLTKSGAGALTLSAANNFSGGLSLTAGTLNVNHASALGPMVNRLTITGGTLDNTSGSAITVANDNVQTWNGSFAFAGTNALNLGKGVITLGGNSTVTVNAGTLTVGGQIYGASSLTKAGAGTLTLSGDSALRSTYSGGLTLSAGTLNLNNATATGTGTFTIQGGFLDNTSGGTVTLVNNNAQSWAGDFGFTGTNALDLGTGAVTLTGNRGLQLNGGVLTVGGVIGGAYSMTKAGAGTLVLNGANTFTGGITVGGGTLVAGASGAINGKGTLNGGNLLIAPGVSLSVDNGLTFASNTAATVAAQGGAAGIYGWDVNSADLIVNTGINGSIASSVSVGTGTYGIRFDVNGTGTLAVAGAITGTGNVGSGVVDNGTLVTGDATALFKRGAGDLTLTGASTFGAGASVAATSLQEGRILLSGGDNRLPTGSAMYLGSSGNTSGKLVLVGVNQSLAGLATVGTGASNAVVGGSVVLSTLTVTNASDYTFAGALGGAGTNENNLAFVKSGAGKLTLTGASTLTGGSTLSAGTLQVGAGGTTGSLAGNLVNNASLVFNRSDDSEFAGVIGGLGTLTKQGAGTLTLSGLNSYAGVTTVAAGTLAVSADSNLGAAPGSATAGQLVLDGGTLSATAGFTLSANRGVALGASGGTLQVASGQTLAYAGVVAGGALTKTGNGVLSLSGTNTHTGATAVNAGTLQLNGGSIAGSAVDVASGATFGGTGSAAATTVASGGALTAGVSGVGTLTLSSLTLSGNATLNLGVAGSTLGSWYKVDGDVIASGAAGSATFAFGSGLASLAFGDYSLLLYSGTELADISAFGWSGTKGGRQTVTLVNQTTATDGYRSIQLHVENAFPVWVGTAGGGSWGYGDTSWKLNTDDSPTDFQATDTVVFRDDAATGTIDLAADVNPSSLTFEGHTLAYTLGSVGGFEITAGSLLKSGNATLTLASANSYAGGTRVTAGTLRVGDDGALGSGALELAGARLTAAGTAARTLGNAVLLSGNATFGDVAAGDTGALTLSGAVDLGGSTRSLTVEVGTTLSGAVTNGGLTKLGNATLVLTGAASYGNGTTVSAGKLQVGANGTAGSIAGNVTVESGANLTFNRSDALTFSGVVSGAGSLTKAGNGTLTLTGANVQTGGTTVSAGTLQVGAGGTVGSIAGNVTVESGASLAFSRSDNLTYAGVVTGAGAMTKLANGTLTLTGTSDFAGGLTLSAGTLRIGNDAALGAGTFSANAGTVSSDGATARTLANAVTIGGDLILGDSVNSGALAFTGAVDLGGSTRTLTNPTAVTFSGAIDNGGLTKAGAGALTLSGANTFAGGLTLSAGTLNLNSAEALGATAGTFTISGGTLNNTSGADLALTTNNAQSWAGNFTFTGTDSLDLGTGSVALTAARTVTVSANTLTVGGAVTGAYALTKAGAGALVLNGSVANSVTVSAGSLTANGAIAGAATLSAGTMTLGSSGSIAGLATVATGTFTSAGSLAGGVAVNGGTLSSSGSLAAGGSVASGATLDISGSAAGNIANAGTLRFSGASDRTYAGNLSGAGATQKTGSGNLTLTGANAAGSLALQGGTLTLGGASALGSIPVTFSAGTTLASTLSASISGMLTFSGAATIDVASGTTLTTSGALVVSNTVTKVGAGTLKLTSYYSGSSSGASSDFVINAGTLEFNTGSWGGSAFSGNNTLNITVNAGGTLRTSASHVYGGTNLNNAINVITVSGGTMTVDGGHYLPSGTVGGRGRLVLDGGTVNGAAEITGSNGTITITSLANAATSTISNANGIRLSFGNGIFDVADGAASVDLLVSNVVSGSGYGVTKSGAGLLQLSGNNTYSNGTIVSAGTLSVSNLADGVNSSIGTGGLTLSGGNLQYTGTGAQNTTRAFSVTAATTLDITSATGELTFSSANAIAKSLTKAGNGRLNLGNALTGATTAVTVNGGTLALSGGAGSTYAGGTTVAAGTLLLGAEGSLGAGLVTVSGGTLDLASLAFAGPVRYTGGSIANASLYAGNLEVAGGTLVLGALGAYGTSTVFNVTGGAFDLNHLNPTGTITLAGGSLVNAENWNVGSVNITSAYTAEQINALNVPSVSITAGTVNLTGVTRDITVAGGTVTGLGGYSGDIELTGGTADLSGGDPTGSITLAGGTVDFGNRASAVGISYASGAVTGSAYTGVLTVQGTNISLGSGIAAGTVAVGAGTSATIQSGFARDLLLTGGSLGGLVNYAGNLTVQGTTLDLGTAADPVVTAANVTLAAGATLSGQGSVGTLTVESGGILAPGNSPGLINATDLTLAAGAIGNFQFLASVGSTGGLGGATPVAGIDFDGVAVSGTLDLSALSAGSRFVLNIISLSDPDTDGIISGWDGSVDCAFDIFTYATLNLGGNEALRMGDLTELFGIDSSLFLDASGRSIRADHFHVIDTGYSVQLTYSAVPEPSTYGMMLGGLALAAAAIRRRRRAPAQARD